MQGWSPPSPWSSPPARWYRRLSHGSESPSRGATRDESYVANSDSFSILYPTSQKLSPEPSQVYDDARTTRRRHLSLTSRPLATGDTVRERSPESRGPSRPSQRLHRPRAQSIERDDRQNGALRRAAQRHSTRGLYQDVDDDMTSSSILSPVTPATFTGSKYTSQTRTPRRLQQRVVGAARRRVTSAPPRVRVVVLSKNGTPTVSPSPPIDEFTDIPPVDLLLFEPPTSLNAGVQPSGPSLLPLKASPPRGTRGAWKEEPMEKDEMRSESPPPMTAALEPSLGPSDLEEPPGSPAEPATNYRMTCLQIWVLCVAAAATLCIPLGTVILSYLLTPVRDMSNLTAGPSGTTTSPGTASTAPPTYTFTTPLNPTTVDPWNGVPQHCQAVPMVDDKTSSVKAQTSPPVSQSNRTGIFCLYNNTRFYRGGKYDFLPRNLPFTLCPNIVYWSFAVRDGFPISRVESFDRTYGLEKLSEVVNKSRVPGVRILLTVGGYLEDYGQLSLLGRDVAALSRFVRRTMELMKSHFLDGVVIHWVEGEPLCKYSAIDDGQVLRTVFLGLRRIFRLNSFSGQLAAIVSAGAQAVVDTILDMVDFVFIEARDEWHSVPLSYTMCADWRRAMIMLINSQPRYHSNEAKFCLVMSVAPLLVVGRAPYSPGDPPLFVRISGNSSYGSAPGIGSAWDMCRPQGGCCLETSPNWSYSCTVWRHGQSSTPLYVTADPTTVTKVFELGSLQNRSHRCMLLVDLDLDNYANQSDNRFPEYWLTRYIHGALSGKAADYFDWVYSCGNW